MGGEQRLRKSNDRNTIEYLKQMLLELRAMAEANRDDMLAYMIEMAYVEASDRLREIRAAEIKADQKAYFLKAHRRSTAADIVDA